MRRWRSGSSPSRVGRYQVQGLWTHALPTGGLRHTHPADVSVRMQVAGADADADLGEGLFKGFDGSSSSSLWSAGERRAATSMTRSSGGGIPGNFSTPVQPL